MGSQALWDWCKMNAYSGRLYPKIKLTTAPAQELTITNLCWARQKELAKK